MTRKRDAVRRAFRSVASIMTVFGSVLAAASPSLILKEALERSRSKKSELAHALIAAADYPVGLVASTLGVGRSTVYDRLTGSA